MVLNHSAFSDMKVEGREGRREAEEDDADAGGALHLRRAARVWSSSCARDWPVKKRATPIQM